MNKKISKRETNIDLLRILAMLMVITLHSINNPEISAGNVSFSMYNTILIRFLDSLSLTANGIFIIISGYYMIDKKMNLKKILSLWGRVLFYSILIYIVSEFVLGIKTTTYESFFPLLTGQYWFISAYIVLCFLSPVLNILANKLSQKQYKYFIVFMIVTLGIIKVFFEKSGTFSGTLLPVFMLYFIGGYIRKYIEIKEKQYYFAKYILLACIFTLIFIILAILPRIIIPKAYGSIVNFLADFRQHDNLIMIAMTIFVLLKFRTIKIKSQTINQIITFIVPSVFSVYLIHYNINIRWYIWNLLGINYYANTWYFIPYLLCTIILVFISCLAIDLLRRGGYALLKKVPIINKGITKLNEKINYLNNKINSIFD